VDWTIFVFLAPAIAASLIIAGIHAYLGLHVVERGVIFVDLSLAQIRVARRRDRRLAGIRPAR
jgi:zinc/manganese transport system permease protein